MNVTECDVNQAFISYLVSKHLCLRNLQILPQDCSSLLFSVQVFNGLDLTPDICFVDLSINQQIIAAFTLHLTLFGLKTEE